MHLDPASLHVVAQMDDPDAIKNSVSQGLGISIMSKTAAADFPAFGLIQTFDFDHGPQPQALLGAQPKPHPLPSGGVSALCQEGLPAPLMTLSLQGACTVSTTTPIGCTLNAARNRGGVFALFTNNPQYSIPTAMGCFPQNAKPREYPGANSNSILTSLYNGRHKSSVGR